MIVVAFVPKPDETLAIFRDRINARDAVNALACPDHVHTGSTHHACLARCNHRLRRRCRFVPPFRPPVERAGVTRSRPCAWKAIFPAICRSEIRSSMRSYACSVVPSTAFSRAPSANNAPSGRPATRERHIRAESRFGSVEVLS
jgi:hypothetical protein